MSLALGGNLAPESSDKARPDETEGHMRRPTTIAIATMGLIALMFWLGMGATGKDADVVNAPLKPEYALTSDPYLPGRSLEPAY
jgi:hypothetical protein